MSMARVLGSLAAVFIATAASENEMQCQWDSGQGASFDLSALVNLPIKPVRDRIQTDKVDYVYTFGICKSVLPPANCKVDPTLKYTGGAPAWQTKASESPATMPSGQIPFCKYLGNPDLKQNTVWTLLNDQDPSMGLVLTYTGGQSCHSGTMKRGMAIKFMCSKNQLEKIEQEVIDESAHCQYDIMVESEYACPKECGFGSAGTMCNAHGICRYDTDAKQARCFCNSGYTGPGCDQPDDGGEQGGSYGPMLGLLIFVTITMVVLIGGIAYLWRYLQQRTIPEPDYGRFQIPSRDEIDFQSDSTQHDM